MGRIWEVKRLETRGWRLEIEGWRLEIEGWRLDFWENWGIETTEAGDWRLDF
jgi:hypothetical protein